MNIALITGGSGHVGANLVRELTKQDFKVRCIDFDRDHRAFDCLLYTSPSPRDED